MSAGSLALIITVFCAGCIEATAPSKQDPPDAGEQPAASRPDEARRILLAVLGEARPVEVNIECMGAAPGAMEPTCDLAADRRLAQFRADVASGVTQLRDLARALPPGSLEFDFGIEVNGHADGLGLRVRTARLASRTCSDLAWRLGLHADCGEPNRALACARGLYAVEAIGPETIAPLRRLPSTAGQRLSVNLICTEHSAIGSTYRGVALRAWMRVAVQDVLVEGHARLLLQRGGWQTAGDAP